MAERAAQRQIRHPRQRGQRTRLDEIKAAVGGGSSHERGLADTRFAVDEDGPAPGDERPELLQLRLPPDEHVFHCRACEDVAQLHDESGAPPS